MFFSAVSKPPHAVRWVTGMNAADSRVRLKPASKVQNWDCLPRLCMTEIWLWEKSDEYRSACYAIAIG